jgi:hypothetical protein
MKCYTAYCSFPDSPRGQYDEEIDVQAVNPAQAKRIAQQIIAVDYDPDLRVRRIVASPFITIQSF